MDEESNMVPYFPLSVFLLPGEDIPLRIYEPRYKQLVEDMRHSDITFVIPFMMEDKIQEYGCEVRLKDVLAENPGGRMVITVESLHVVKILSYAKHFRGKLYAGGAIARLPASEHIRNAALLEMIKNYTDQFDPKFLRYCKESVISYHDVIKALNLPSEEKYRFISMPDPTERDNFLAGQLRYLKMIRHQETMLGDDFGLN